jgi:hypothetical protein
MMDGLRRNPLQVRKATLASIVAKARPGIRFNEHIEGDGPTVFAHACKMGLEGIVSKRKDSAYRSGRSPDWLKMKNPVAPAVKREAEEDWGKEEENEWPREDHTNPFAQPERTGIVRVHQKSQDQPGAKVEPSRRTTAPDRRAQAVLCRRRHQPRRPPLAKIKGSKTRAC